MKSHITFLDCKAGENHCTRTYDECEDGMCGKFELWYISPISELIVIMTDDVLENVSIVFVFSLLLTAFNWFMNTYKCCLVLIGNLIKFENKTSAYQVTSKFIQNVCIWYHHGGGYYICIELYLMKFVETCADKGMFECQNHQCIDKTKRCDGKKDCFNGLDEYRCGKCIGLS